MSCVSFLTPQQRAELRKASRDRGGPLSRFASPAVSAGKLQRIRLMSIDPDATIRQSAALNVHTPAEVLQSLAADGDPAVRACVARNINCPTHLLASLSTDDSEQVRGWVAAHRNAPAETLEQLDLDPSLAVRRIVQWAHGWNTA